MLRNIIFYIAFFPLTLFFSAVAAASRRAAPWAARTWSTWIVRVAGLSVRADLAALDPAQRYIFIVNHQSQLDIPVLTHVLRARHVGFVAKESLFRIPLFGRALECAGHVSVDRGNPRRAMKSLEEAANKAREGANILVFAEGTRQRNLEALGEFKVGGMILALKTGLPVAPLVVHGTGEALPKGRLLLRRAPIRVRALPPVPAGSYTLKQREQLRDDLHAMMNTAYQELRRD
jgi:1-acyl-sn-glycerol-3-phosphate acyltransferase